jgi:branched-chain amino acid transport system permease protein
MIKKTRFGLITRAGVDDRDMVGALGINVPLVFAGAFLIGALLAGFGGVLGGTMLSLQPGHDTLLLLNSLIVVIIGGMGSLGGAAIGALLVGLADNFGKALFPEISYFTLYAPMALILAVKPTGLFGRE